MPSAFTYKQLHQLQAYSPQTPLRVIAHVDLDSFYAQCETVRLGLDPAKPLAVQQWQGLIAINYPARAFGLSRHVTATEARRKCPELILQHVATWKEGDETWAYHDDAARDMATHKVSLDPYRQASRRILQCIRDALPADGQRVEKASIDEVFLDLSAHVHSLLLERYPELRGPAPGDDASERLPKVPTTVLDWAADALVDTGTTDGEDTDPDWDDVCLVLASELVRRVRRHIHHTLGYTCSAGVARNKMLSKLGSAYHKPNQQTVIRNRAVAHFLADMPFTKIRMLGGKLGDEIVALFGTDKVSDLLQQPRDQLQRLGDDTGSWLYSTIRGDDSSEVNPRTQIKSMLSAKSFRPAIQSFAQAVRWLRIFVADIFSRCVEEGVLQNKRRPTTLNLHHRQGAHTRSRQAPIPQGKPLSEAILFELAKNLLAHVVVDGRAWPCANLSLSVGGFEDGITNNKGIGGFLVRGDEAKAILSTVGRSIMRNSSVHEPPTKRRRTKGNIANFFGPKDDNKKDFDTARALLMSAHNDSTREEIEDGVDLDADEQFESLHSNDVARPSTPPPPLHSPDSDIETANNRCVSTTPPSAQPPARHFSLSPHPPQYQNHGSATPIPRPKPPSHTPNTTKITTYHCMSCNIHLPLHEKEEHVDYHYALDLSRQMRQAERQPPVQAKRGGRGKGKSDGRGKEKGQAKLMFGQRG